VKGNGMGKEKKRKEGGVMAFLGGGRPEISPPRSFLKVGAYDTDIDVPDIRQAGYPARPGPATSGI